MQGRVYIIDPLWKKKMELEAAAEEEIRLITEKHKDVLDKREAEGAEIGRLLTEFNATWDHQLVPYRKEISAARRRHRRLRKLAEQETQTLLNYADNEVNGR